MRSDVDVDIEQVPPSQSRVAERAEGALRQPDDVESLSGRVSLDEELP